MTAGVRPARALTGRHLQVLRLAKLEYSNTRIGRELGIAAGTVDKHLLAIRALLGASSKREAVEFATEAGLL